MDIHCFCGPATTFALSMNYNIPSIVLWNPFLNEKSEYSELFEELEIIGIICRDPQSFVEKFRLISTNEYWFGHEVQKVRKCFCDAFAVTEKNWKSDLNGIILEKCLTQAAPRQI